MHLHCWPCWWPWRCARAIQTASPNEACLGLLWKPLDTAEGHLLALYCSSGHQGNSKQKNDDKIDLIRWPFQWPWQCAGSIPRYSRSHWMPPSGNYLLRITPAAARATAKKTTTTNCPTLLSILLAMAMPQYHTTCIARWRMSRTLLEATGCCHQVSIAANRSHWTCICCFFTSFFIINL